MKIYVISDIHGSIKYLKDFFDYYDKESRLIILGDVLYHGPRNDLPLEYNPKEVIKLLNSYKDKILWIKGNCDSEVDEMVLDFKVYKEAKIRFNDYNIYLTHGHINNESNMSLKEKDILLYGHTHINKLEKINGYIVGNPGSISLPKENTKNSFMVIEDSCITIYSLENEVLYRLEI